MKKIILLAFLHACACIAMAQDTLNAGVLPAPAAPVVPVDKSPMDMSYFPDQYPLLKFQGKVTTPPIIRVIYGRPQKDGRTIFGELIRYNEIWRIGANEATEIEFYKDVKIDNKKVAKGRYTVYCLPTPTDWTLIINKDTDSWGAFKYDVKKDILRVKVPAQKTAGVVETFSMKFDKTTTGAQLIISWDNTMAKLPITIL